MLFFFFFFIVSGQGVKRNFELRGGDVWRAAYQFKVNRIFTFGALGEQLVAQQRDFVSQAVLAMDHTINSAFWDTATAAKSFAYFRHVVARG